MLKKSNSLKINIDNFNSTKDFELYFFNYLKDIHELEKNKILVIYTLKQDKDILHFIQTKIILKLVKLNYYLDTNNIIIKFINFPYCLLSNQKQIEKYFLNKIFNNYEDIIPKKDIECLICKYYTSCSWIKNDSFLPSSFKVESILKEEYLYKLRLLINFFNNIWIKNENIMFDLKHNKWNFKNISKSVVNRMIIDVNSDNINYNEYFIDIENYREQHRVNLIFKSYIINKKFNLLLKDQWVSTYIRFISFKWNNNKIYKYDNIEINYWNLNLDWQIEDKIFDYINENISVEIKHEIWDSFFWRKLDWLSKLTIIKPRVLLLDNINKIKKDFDKYIVLFNDRNLNNYIPHIYKFKYFMTYNDDILNSNIAHFQIIFKEMWVLCIDSVSTHDYFGLENDDLLEVNFNIWLITRVW